MQHAAYLIYVHIRKMMYVLVRISTTTGTRPTTLTGLPAFIDAAVASFHVYYRHCTRVSRVRVFIVHSFRIGGESSSEGKRVHKSTYRSNETVINVIVSIALQQRCHSCAHEYRAVFT